MSTIQARIHHVNSDPRAHHSETGVHSATPRHATERGQNFSVHGVLTANLLIIANTILRSCATLLLMPLMIGVLGTERYGLWITVSTVTMYLSLSELGLGQTIVNQIGRAYSQGKRQRITEIMATSHVLYWMIVLPVGAVSLLLILILPIGEIFLSGQDAHLEPLLKVCLSLSVTLALARIPMLVFPGLLIGVRKLPLRVVWEIGGTLFSLATTVIALLLGANLICLAITMNLSLLASTAAICLSSARCGEWSRLRLFRFNSTLLRPLLTNSCFFFLISMAGVLDRSLAILLVPRFASLAAIPSFFLLTSIFRVAAFSCITALPRAVQPYVIMWDTKGEKARLASTAKLFAKGTTILATLAVLLLAPFAELFVEVWIGVDCYPGNTILGLIAGSFLIDTLSCTPIFFLIAMNRQRALSLLLLSKTVLTAVLAIAFANRFANPLEGIATGALAASVLTGLCIPYLMRSRLGITWRAYLMQFLARPLAHMFFISILVAFALLPLALASKAVATLALASLSLWGGWCLVFDEQDRAVVVQALGRLRQKGASTTDFQ